MTICAKIRHFLTGDRALSNQAAKVRVSAILHQPVLVLVLAQNSNFKTLCDTCGVPSAWRANLLLAQRGGQNGGNHKQG